VRAYSTREVAELAGLDEGRIRRWVRAGLVAPHKDERGDWRYSFQDAALLRTASKLLDAGLTPRRVTSSLRLIRKQIPAGRPLSAVRIVVTGKRVIVKDRLASWEPESRQALLDLGEPLVSTEIAPIMPARLAADADPPDHQGDDDGEVTAEDLYHAAVDLELAGRNDEALAHYEAALRGDPALVAARINLGRLLHQAQRLTEAEVQFRNARALDPHNALAAFNLGVTLEDLGKADAAIEAYRAALALDDEHADAHFNLSRLLEAKGDKQGALRHLSRFSRLIRQQS
jgi:tetratricopeptide (TPR) repeat protein